MSKYVLCTCDEKYPKSAKVTEWIETDIGQEATLNNYYNSYFKVNLDEVVRNYKRVIDYVNRNRTTEQPVGLIPVVKGNCYGYGLVEMARLYEKECGAELIAVSAVWEAVELRSAGIKADILITGGIPRKNLTACVDYDLQPAVFEEGAVSILKKYAEEKGKQVKIQIKIETGMNRLGVKPGEPLENLLDQIAESGNIIISGVFTHFATSTMDYYEPFAIRQYERFKEALCQFEQRGTHPRYIHCCNSAATAWFKEAYFTHVRNCTSPLGHEAMEDGREPIGLVDTLEIGTWITNIHDIEQGESVGYDHAFVADRPIRVATLSIGFADGFYPKWMRGRGPVLINGKRARFLGCCMDQSFVDVTGIDCEIGDKAILIGESGEEKITTWDMECLLENTFEYLYGTIGPRVERIYQRD